MPGRKNKSRKERGSQSYSKQFFRKIRILSHYISQPILRNSASTTEDMSDTTQYERQISSIFSPEIPNYSTLALPDDILQLRSATINIPFKNEGRRTSGLVGKRGITSHMPRWHVLSSTPIERASVISTEFDPARANSLSELDTDKTFCTAREFDIKEPSSSSSSKPSYNPEAFCVFQENVQPTGLNSKSAFKPKYKCYTVHEGAKKAKKQRLLNKFFSKPSLFNSSWNVASAWSKSTENFSSIGRQEDSRSARRDFGSHSTIGEMADVFKRTSLEPINCKVSRNSSIDSVLSNDNGFSDTRVTTGYGSIDADYVHSRRSFSWVREGQREKNGVDDYGRARGAASVPAAAVDVKRMRKSAAAKESGSKKFLHFLQRGFHAKRTKSHPKLRKKMLTEASETEDSLEDLLDAPEFTVSPVEGVRILGQQIGLPMELLIAHLNGGGRDNLRCLSFPLTTCLERSSVIYPIDGSLFNTESRHCFQVVSYQQDSNAKPVPSNVTVFDQPSAITPKKDAYIHTYTCPTSVERNRWMLYLKRLVHPTRDTERRREHCLHIWIQEAKGLVGRHRYHCEIIVDGKLYAKTTNKRMTDMVFWGEEFDLSGLSEFKILTVQLWADTDRKVNPKRSNRTSIGARDRTSAMLMNDQRISSSYTLPFGRSMMSCAKGSGMGEELQNGFDHTQMYVDYPETPMANGKTRQRNKRSRESVLIASVEIPVSNLGSSNELECWYPAELHELSGPLKLSDIVEVAGKNRTGRRDNQGQSSPSGVQLRIKTKYRSVTVLPLADYGKLQAYLSSFRWPDEENALLPQPDSALLLSDLDTCLGVKMKSELAGSVVALQQALRQAPDFLAVLILHEVKKQSDPNMVLRGNSIATKATEIYLRLIGETYLSNVLGDFVRSVLMGRVNDSCPESGKTPKQKAVSKCVDCEVDPNKLEHSAQLSRNQMNLIELVQMVWNRILESEKQFPSQLRVLFTTVRKHLDATYPAVNPPDGASLSDHVISACVFLRYLCPAILSPSLFGLTIEFPSDQSALRTFTLVAKTIQSLANFSLFSGSKEAYMTFMNRFVSDQLPIMRQFLRAISAPTNEVSPGGSHVTSTCTTAAAGRPHSSRSHHSGFQVAGSTGSWLDTPSSHFTLNGSSLMTRSSSGLAAITPQSASELESERPQTATGFQSNGLNEPIQRLCEPLPLPFLHVPSRKYSSTTSTESDHIDLALCLALCHLQLSEALANLSTDKSMPTVAGLKSILDEIDFFLSTGIDPPTDWLWMRKKSITDIPSVLLEQNGSFTTMKTSNTVHPTKESVKLTTGWKNVMVSSAQADQNCEYNSTEARRQMSRSVTEISRSNGQFTVFLSPGPKQNQNMGESLALSETQHRSAIDNHENIDPTVSPETTLSQSSSVLSQITQPQFVVGRVLPVTFNEQRAQEVQHSMNGSYPGAQPASSITDTQQFSSENKTVTDFRSAYETQGSSSGYYSLGRNVDQHTNSLNQSVTPTVTFATMNNPLYIVHKPSTRSSSSGSTSTHSSPTNQALKQPSVPGNPTRSKSFSSQEFRRRHTYVNWTANTAVDLTLSAIRDKSAPDGLSHTSSRSIIFDEDVDHIRPQNSTLIKGATIYSGRSADYDRSSSSQEKSSSALNRQVKISGAQSVRSTGHSTSRRTPITVMDFRSNVPTHIRDELDASQARLAEAQARLLANEAERIQLLRAWHNELIRQSQLVNHQGGLTESHDHLPEADQSRWLLVSEDWRPSTAIPPLTVGHTRTLSNGDIWAPCEDKSGSSSKVSRITQPRMGASVLPGANDLTMPRAYYMPHRQPLRWLTEQPAYTNPETRSSVIIQSPSSPGLFDSSENTEDDQTKVTANLNGHTST